MSSPPPPSAYPHPGAPPELPELPEGVVRRRRPTTPGWRAWTAPVALIAALALALFGAMVIGITATAFGYSLDDEPPGVLIGGTLFQDGALILCALLFARLAQRPRPWHFGLRRARFWSSAGWTLLAWATFIGFSAAWSALLDVQETDDLPQELGADESTAALVAVMFLVTVVAPIAEEFFFRGYFFTALRSWRGVWPAAILTGVVFGGIHAGSSPPAFLVPLGVFGLVLCLLYWRTGSLYPPIVLHALNNSIAFGVTQDWGWEIPLLMVGSNLVIAALVLPAARLGGGRGELRPA